MQWNCWIKKAGYVGLMLAIASCTVEQPTSNSASPTPISTTTTSAADRPTPVAAAPITNIRTTTVLEGLEHPWSMAWLPDGSILITERPGRLRIVRDGVLDPTPIAGVPEVLVVSQAGLLDISLHPRFAENRLLYLTYSHGTPQANRTRVARAVFDGQTLSNLQVIFEVERDKSQGQHFGSRITWLPDETMLVSIGDGGNPPIQLDGALIRQQAQNLKTRLGKIVRLNDDGSIPADNPFVNADAEPAIWSYGHRNIQGLTIDPATNQVWATEHGSRGGDETNLIEAGQNYGWPLVTYSREYSGGVISNEQSRPGLIDPRQVWTPSIAPSGLALYRGDRLAAWDGDLFAGGLVSQTVHRLDLDESGNVIDQQPIEIGQRVRDVKQGPDGLLYVLTDEPNGRLIRLEPEV